MGRPQKQGLDFFPHDTDMSDDDKILYLESIYGLKGYAVYNKLLERIYRTPDGKLDISSDIVQSILAKKFKISRKLFQDILKTCVDIKLLSHEEFQKNLKLTSDSIQRRLLMIYKERERKRNWKNNHKKEPKNEAIPEIVDGENQSTIPEVDDENKNSRREVDDENKNSRRPVDEFSSDSRRGKEKEKESKSKYNISSSKEDGVPPKNYLKILKENLNNATNKVGYLGRVFKELHLNCTKNDEKTCYERLGVMAKRNNYDYDRILIQIFRTQDELVNIDGSHLNYIEALLGKNNGSDKSGNNSNGNGGGGLKVNPEYQSNLLKQVEELESSGGLYNN